MSETTNLYVSVSFETLSLSQTTNRQGSIQFSSLSLFETMNRLCREWQNDLGHLLVNSLYRNRLPTIPSAILPIWSIVSKGQLL